MVVCLERGANDWHMVQLMPLPPPSWLCVCAYVLGKSALSQFPIKSPLPPVLEENVLRVMEWVTMNWLSFLPPVPSVPVSYTHLTLPTNREV